MSRILHSLNLDTVGGVESIFADYLTHPGSAAHEHHLMILNRHCHPFFKKAVLSHMESVFHARYYGPFRISGSLRVPRATRYAANLKPDILMVYNTPDNACAWTAADHTRTCIYYERGAAWWASARDDAVMRHFQRTNRFFCNSHAAKRLLNLRFAIPESLCDVIYNPMRFENRHPRPKREPGRFRIGMAGRLIPAKGMIIGLHAMAELLKKDPHFELVIAGTGPELEMLQTMAQKLGISHAVTFLGVMQDMSEFYHSLDLFVCPSLREPLGNVAIEANGSGCPVICTQVDGLPEAIIPGETGLCLPGTVILSDYRKLGVSSPSLPHHVYDPARDEVVQPRALNPSTLAEAIWDLASSPDKRAAMSLAASESVKERFSLEGYVKRLHELIEKASAHSS